MLAQDLGCLDCLGGREDKHLPHVCTKTWTLARSIYGLATPRWRLVFVVIGGKCFFIRRICERKALPIGLEVEVEQINGKCWTLQPR